MCFMINKLHENSMQQMDYKNQQSYGGLDDKHISYSRAMAKTINQLLTKNFIGLLLPLLLLLLVTQTFVKALDPNEKSWTYTLIDISVSSTDESIAKVDARIERMGRSEFGFSGTIDVGIALPKTIEVEVITYRSTDSGKTYILQPYSVPKQDIYTIMNKYYSKFIMESVKDCSNLPYFTDEMTVMGPETYHFDKCQVKTDNFPQYLPEGYYKVSIQASGDVQVICEVIVNIEKKTF